MILIIIYNNAVFKKALNISIIKAVPLWPFAMCVCVYVHACRCVLNLLKTALSKNHLLPF